MSNETDLYWLARNVHVWPAGCTLIGRILKDGQFFTASIAGFHVAGIKWFTRDQWLARRAELQGKPSWDSAPEWATHLAQAANGCWFFLGGNSVKLRTNDLHGQVWSASQAETRDWKGEVLGDWRETLERRPEEFKPSIEQANKLAQEFRPFISIEDNQELNTIQKQKMNQDNGWFERGDLPPVGVDCQAYVDERWVDAYVVGFIKNGAVTVDVRAYQGGVKSGLRLVTRNAAHFRPIRTEQDVLMSVLECYSGALPKERQRSEVASAILAAGFKLEEK